MKPWELKSVLFYWNESARCLTKVRKIKLNDLQTLCAPLLNFAKLVRKNKQTYLDGQISTKILLFH